MYIINMDNYNSAEIYENELENKPKWSPEPETFSKVWSVLYVIIAISFGWVFYNAYFKNSIPNTVATPFAINLIGNLLYTYIMFKLRNENLALLDIIVVLISLAWGMNAVYPYAEWVTIVNIPHFVWLIIATFLQVKITCGKKSIKKSTSCAFK